MKRALQAATIIALLALARAAWLVGDAAKSTAHSARQIAAAVVIPAKSAGEILVNVRLATDAFKDSSEKQAAYWQSVSSRTTRILDRADTTIADLDGLVKRTDENLNASLLPQTADAMKSADAAISDAGAMIRALSLDSHRTLEATAKAAENMAAVSGDPNIPKSLASLAATSEQAVRSMEHIEATTRDVQAYTHRLVAPISWVKRVATQAASLLASFAGGYFR